MFNNINDNNNDILYNAQLEKQSNIINFAAIRNRTANNAYSVKQNPYVDKSEISSEAIELFQKDCDISKFTKIAMSDEDDLSHIDLMNKLFSEGVVDVFEDDILQSLVTNPKLLDDLEL